MREPRDGLLQQYDTPHNLFHHPANLFVAAFMGSPAMNLVDAEIQQGRVSFGGHSFVLPADSSAGRVEGTVVLGIRPTDFEHGAAADAELPRLRVKPEVVEDLGSESHVIFTLDAPRVVTEAVRAATEDNEDEGQLFADDRAIFTACLDSRRPVQVDAEIELAVEHRRLHFFDPATGLALTG
jgi:multiple sugar transport system ATP-binding protein